MKKPITKSEWVWSCYRELLGYEAIFLGYAVSGNWKKLSTLADELGDFSREIKRAAQSKKLED